MAGEWSLINLRNARQRRIILTLNFIHPLSLVYVQRIAVAVSRNLATSWWNCSILKLIIYIQKLYMCRCPDSSSTFSMIDVASTILFVDINLALLKSPWSLLINFLDLRWKSFPKFQTVYSNIIAYVTVNYSVLNYSK